jgi:hypothetical protein
MLVRQLLIQGTQEGRDRGREEEEEKEKKNKSTK